MTPEATSDGGDDATAPIVARFSCALCRAVYRTSFTRCPRDGGRISVLEVDPVVGTTIAERYAVEAVVGEGAMGRVYRAQHTRMDRRFAIKVLFGDFAADENMRARFSHEANAASRLDHPNVISVVDFGETGDGIVYLVMDFIQGRDLATILEEEAPLEQKRVVHLMREICRGLHHAHSRGLVHRDLKAENVMVLDDAGTELPKIVDFGLAILNEANREVQRLTAVGHVVGTPAYMSPEQACAQELDLRTDLFSLGLLAYELLAGQKPFDGTPLEVARLNVMSEQPPISVRSPGVTVDPELEAIIRKLLQKNREDRYPTAKDVIDALDKLEAAWRKKTAKPSVPPPNPSVPPVEDPMIALLVDAQKRDTLPPPGVPEKKLAAARARDRELSALTAPEQDEPRSIVKVIAPVAAGVVALGIAVAFFSRTEIGSTIAGPSGRVEPLVAVDPPAGATGMKVTGATVAAARAGSATASGTRASTDPETSPGAMPAPVGSDDVAAETPDDAQPATASSDEVQGEPSESDPPPKGTEKRSRTTRRRDRDHRDRDAREAREARDSREPESAAPPAVEVKIEQLTRSYREVGASLDRLAKDRGQKAAAPLQERYFAIPYADAIRIPEVRREAMDTLQKLARDVKREMDR